MKLIGAFCCALSLLNVAAQEQTERPRIEWDGYARLLANFSYINQSAFGNLGNFLPANYQDYQIHQRLNARYQIRTKWYFELGLRNRLFWGYQVRQQADAFKYLDADMGQLDLSWTLWSGQHTAMVSVLDRLYGRYTSAHWDIRLGRQRINWGKNTVWNPNDIFNQYNYLDFDYEERPGVDALSVQYFFSGFKSLEVAYAPGREDDLGVAATRFTFPIGVYDFQLLSGIYHDDWTFGAGWAGNIKGVGFKGEVTYYTPRNALGSINLLFSPSVDYSFTNQLYVQLGYLFNQAGSESTLALSGISGGQVLEAKNLFPFKSSFFVQCTYPLHPLLTADLSGILTSGGTAAILIPSIRYNWKQNIDFLLLSQFFMGNDVDNRFDYLTASVFARVSYSF